MWSWVGLWVTATVFAAPVEPARWRVVNDTVMGGRSTGQIEAVDNGVMRFTGRLSLENNGGFASVRSVPQALDMGDVSAIKLRVKGDGRTWSLNLYRRDVPLRAGSYRAKFTTRPKGITEVVIPLAEFEPTSFGRWVPGVPSLDSAPEQITQVGFMLGDKNPGPYTLTVLSVEDVREADARGLGADEVVVSLTDAVSAGVPLFNAGDVVGCRDLYRSRLEALVDHEAVTPGEQRTVRLALASAEELSAERGAWALRYAIDTLLSGMR